jgi:hypothetical protein
MKTSRYNSRCEAIGRATKRRNQTQEEPEQHTYKSDSLDW